MSDSERKAMSVRMSEETYERVRQSAADRQMSANYLINLAIDEFLDRLVPVEEMKWTR